MRRILNFSKEKTSIVQFMVPIILILISDNILSFIVPITLNSIVGSSFIVGLIVGLSSLVGLFSDFIFPSVLKSLSWKIQFLVTIILALFFPIISALGSIYGVVWIFVLVSILWGIYYELLIFSEEDFVNTEEVPRDYSRDWSLLLSLNVVTNISGPIVGSALLLLPVWNYTFALVGLVVIALVYTVAVFGVQVYDKNIAEIPRKRKLGLSRELFRELKLWKEIARESVPFLIMYFVLNWVDMTFFVLGGIFGIELQGNSGMEWIVLIVYHLPSIVATIVIFRSGIYRKKKLYAIFALIIGGVFFSLLGFVGGNKTVVLGLIFAGSVAIGFAWPLSKSILSDLGRRAGPYKKQFMGLYNATASVACCTAPSIMGLIADSIGYYWMFSIMGVTCIIVGVLLLSIVPKRILVMHQKLEAVDVRT